MILKGASYSFPAPRTGVVSPGVPEAHAYLRGLSCVLASRVLHSEGVAGGVRCQSSGMVALISVMRRTA